MSFLPPLSAAELPADPVRRGPGRWIAFDHSRVLLPQFTFARRTDPLARLHRLALDDRPDAPAPGLPGRWCARLILAGLALRQMAVYYRRYGRYVRTHDGIPRWRQFRDLWHCIWRHNHYARHYYWRKLYRLPDRAQWLENLEHRQLTTLLRHLNRRLPITRVTDKCSFHRHCLGHGLPTPAVLAAWDAQGRPLQAAGAPFAGDLFIKPIADFGSVGIMALPWDAATGTHQLEGRALAWPDLLAGLSALACRHGRSVLLQPRLRNAPRLALYGNFDLCNLRIVTARPPDGEPEALGSFIRLPSRFTTGGYGRQVLFAPVNIATGCMSAGRLREITSGEFLRHPETRAPIAARRIPGWDEMLALALAAHRTVPWLPFVGWDIVDTEQGVMVLEANAFWGGDALQPSGATPLGRTRFPGIYLAWYDRMHAPAPPERAVTPAP